MKPQKTCLGILVIFFAVSCNNTRNHTATPTTTSTPLAINTPIPTATPSPSMMFQQDFESGIPSGITIWSNWNVEISDSGSHVFCNAPSDSWIGGTIGHDSWGDYAIEMKFQFQDLKPNQSVSVDSRKNSDSSKKYSGDLHYGGVELNFYEPYVPMGNRTITTKTKTWYTLRVESAGNHFKYFVDNILLANGSDDNRQQGFGGFSVSPNTSICIDDIRVWALTKDGALAEAPALSTVSIDNTVTARLNFHKYPKLFIQNQELAPSDHFLNESAYWDIIILDIETVITKPDYLGPSGLIRTSNPNSVIMTYYSAADIILDDPHYIRAKFTSLVKPEWYVKDIYGNIYHLFPAEGDVWTPMFNMSTEINTFMPNYLRDNVMSANLVDGIFYDWINESFSFLRYRNDNPPNSYIDINLDGQADSEEEINMLWSQGTRRMLSESRKVFPDGSLIVGNGGGSGSLWVDTKAKSDDIYLGLLNGRMLEGFLSPNSGIDWQESMRAAALMDQASSNPKVPMFMAYGAENDFDNLRFTLASALMLDGYFAMTESRTWFNSSPYRDSWWFDEYSVDLSTGQAIKSLEGKGFLGMPLNEGYNVDDKEEKLRLLLLNNDLNAKRRIWRRDFQNGIVLVNPSGNVKTVDLNGQFRKILGIKDPDFNDGSVVTIIDLPPRSGIILLNMP